MTAADGGYGLRAGDVRFVSRVAAKALASAAAHEIVYGSQDAQLLIGAMANRKGPSVSQFESLRWYCVGDVVRDGETAKGRITEWLTAAKARAKTGRGWNSAVGNSEHSPCVADALLNALARACDVQGIVRKAMDDQAPCSVAGRVASVMLSEAKTHLGSGVSEILLASASEANIVGDTLAQVITLLTDEVRASRTRQGETDAD